jgi:hypothetical protein
MRLQFGSQLKGLLFCKIKVWKIENCFYHRFIENINWEFSILIFLDPCLLNSGNFSLDYRVECSALTDWISVL